MEGGIARRRRRRGGGAARAARRASRGAARSAASTRARSTSICRAPRSCSATTAQPTDIVEAPRTIAHRAIEEAMLRRTAPSRRRSSRPTCPRSTASTRRRRPEIVEQLARAARLASGCSTARRGAPLDAREIAAAAAARRRPARGAPGPPRWRCAAMRPARYDARCLGHFALAFDAICTSPRRSGATPISSCTARCTSCSRRCRGARTRRTRAEAARVGRAPRLASASRWKPEREMVDLKKGVFLRDHLGEASRAP